MNKDKNNIKPLFVYVALLICILIGISVFVKFYSLDKEINRMNSYNYTGSNYGYVPEIRYGHLTNFQFGSHEERRKFDYLRELVSEQAYFNNQTVFNPDYRDDFIYKGKYYMSNQKYLVKEKGEDKADNYKIYGVDMETQKVVRVSDHKILSFYEDMISSY